MNNFNYKSWISKLSTILNNPSNRYANFLSREVSMLVLTIKLFLRQSGLSKANNLAFSSILSLVPILAVVFMTFKLFGGKEVVDSKVKPYIYNFLTPGSSKQISSYIDSFINSATIETLGTIGVVFLLVSVYFIISSVEEAFNDIWQVKSSRSVAKKLKTYWLIITVSPILFIVSLTLTSIVSESYPKLIFMETIMSFLIFDVVPFLMILLFFAIMVTVIPNCKVQIRYSLEGSLFGTCLYYITKNWFVYYSKTAVSYDIIYGSMAVLPLFMFWVYLFWIIILLSVQISFVRQNFTYVVLDEKYTDVSYSDYLKFAIIITTVLIRDYLGSKEPKSVLDYATKLNIPLGQIKKVFRDLDSVGIVKKVGNNTSDIYIPSIPIKEITIGKIIYALDRRQLRPYNLPEDKLINQIITSYQPIVKEFDDKPISELDLEYN